MIELKEKNKSQFGQMQKIIITKITKKQFEMKTRIDHIQNRVYLNDPQFKLNRV